MLRMILGDKSVGGLCGKDWKTKWTGYFVGYTVYQKWKSTEIFYDLLLKRNSYLRKDRLCTHISVNNGGTILGLIWPL